MPSLSPKPRQERMILLLPIFLLPTYLHSFFINPSMTLVPVQDSLLKAIRGSEKRIKTNMNTNAQVSSEG